MRNGKAIHIRISTLDYQYLKENHISPTDLVRAAIRQVKCVHKWYTSDNIT
jgi:hypothetical protein